MRARRTEGYRNRLSWCRITASRFSNLASLLSFRGGERVPGGKRGRGKEMGANRAECRVIGELLRNSAYSVFIVSFLRSLPSREADRELEKLKIYFVESHIIGWRIPLTNETGLDSPKKFPKKLGFYLQFIILKCHLRILFCPICAEIWFFVRLTIVVEERLLVSRVTLALWLDPFPSLNSFPSRIWSRFRLRSGSEKSGRITIEVFSFPRLSE